MRIPDPIANTTTEAYLAYKAGVLAEGDLKPKLYGPYTHLDAWLAYWAGLTNTYPLDKNNNPECLTDEEALIAYLSGVTDTYPEEFRDPADVRVAAYLKYLVSARWGRPEYPVTNEELYLSMMDAPYIPAGEPSSDIEIDDTAEVPFKDVKMYGDTSQQTYTGKNLFSVPRAQTKSGVTLSINSDGTVNIHGTNSSGSELLFPTYPDISIFSSTSYTLSASKTIPANLGARCEIYNGSTWLRSFVAISSTGQVDTQTPNLANGTRVRMAISIAKDATVNIDNIGFQLEQSSSATSFEPYVGGIPAPNPDYPQAVRTVTGENVVKISDGQGNEQSYEVNLGKNLFDAANADVKTGYILNDSGTEVRDNTGGYTRNYSVVEPNTTYTISGLINAGTRRIYYYDGAKNFISRSDGSGASSWQFTTPANCHFVNVQIYTNRDDATAMAVWQIELGSSATPFAPYFAPIELCKLGTYQDYIYKSGGKWYVRKEVGKLVQNGTETGWYNLSGSTSYARTNAATSFVKNVPFFANRGLTTPTSGTRIKIPNNNLYWYETGYESIEAFKSSLATTNLIVYAPLRTPTDTEITNTALIEQLNALKAGGSYNGKTYIKITATDPNLPGLLKVEAYKYD